MRKRDPDGVGTRHPLEGERDAAHHPLNGKIRAHGLGYELISFPDR